MGKSAHLDRAAKFYRFITPNVAILAGIRALNGLFLYAGEVGLAFFILIFFQRLQGVPTFNVSWLPGISGLSFAGFLACFCGIVLAKGLFEYIECALSYFSEHSFLKVHRSRLTAWLFHARVLDQAEFYRLYMHETAVAGSAWTSIQYFVRAAVVAVPMLLTLLYLSPILTLPLLAILSLMIVPLRFSNRRVRHYGKEYERANSTLSTRLAMTVRNLLLFRIHGMASTEKTFIDEMIERMKGYGFAYGRTTAVSAAYVYLVGTTLILVIGVVSKRVSPEVAAYLIPYLYLLNRFLSQVLAFVSAMPQFRFNYPSMDRLIKWWAEHAHDGIRGRALYLKSTGPCFGTIETPLGWRVSSLSYRFADRSKELFSNYSIEIAPGEAIALVGESGSGKSTLLNLLLGEIHADEGKVEVLLREKAFSIEECRHEVLPRVGYVGAESFLIGGTLRENLVYGLTRVVTDDELRDAIQLAQCQFIFEQEKGLEHILNDQGGGLSAGQKQRLCLARALLRSPKVLILDEATANLDEATESALIDTLSALKGKMTMICATHRKGFLRLADRVIELKPTARLLKSA